MAVNLEKIQQEIGQREQLKCSQERVRDRKSLEGAKVLLKKRFQIEDRAYQKTERGELSEVRLQQG